MKFLARRFCDDDQKDDSLNDFAAALEQPVDEISRARRNLTKNLGFAYLGIVALITVELIVSYQRRAEGNPVLGGIPMYLLLFTVSTYRFIKEWRKVLRKERGEPEPPPRKSYWEQD